MPFPDLSSFGASFIVGDVTVTPSGGFWCSGAIAVSALNSLPLIMRYDSGWDQIAAVELAPMPVEGSPPRGGRAIAISALNDTDIWAVGSATSDGTGVGGPQSLTLHWHINLTPISTWAGVPVPWLPFASVLVRCCGRTRKHRLVSGRACAGTRPSARAARDCARIRGRVQSGCARDTIDLGTRPEKR